MSFLPYADNLSTLALFTIFACTPLTLGVLLAFIGLPRGKSVHNDRMWE